MSEIQLNGTQWAALLKMVVALQLNSQERRVIESRIEAYIRGLRDLNEIDPAQKRVHIDSITKKVHFNATEQTKSCD